MHQGLINERLCNEYLLAISPNNSLQEKIREVKDSFSTDFKTQLTSGSRTYISLVHFTQMQVNEDTFMNKLRKILNNSRPITVRLNGFGSFPTHSIFINIESKQQVQNLVKECKAVQSLMTIDKETKPHFIANPHIIVARKLLPWQYEKGWKEYSHRSFTGTFIATEVLLLKRAVKENAYKPATTFPLLNLAHTCSQAKLFN